jgi:hypothetical protein
MRKDIILQEKGLESPLAPDESLHPSFPRQRLNRNPCKLSPQTPHEIFEERYGNTDKIHPKSLEADVGVRGCASQRLGGTNADVFSAIAGDATATKGEPEP